MIYVYIYEKDQTTFTISQLITILQNAAKKKKKKKKKKVIYTQDIN